MPIEQQLLNLDDPFNFFGLSTFTQNIPAEWVARALQGGASDTSVK